MKKKAAQKIERFDLSDDLLQDMPMLSQSISTSVLQSADASGDFGPQPVSGYLAAAKLGQTAPLVAGFGMQGCASSAHFNAPVGSLRQSESFRGRGGKLSKATAMNAERRLQGFAEDLEKTPSKPVPPEFARASAAQPTAVTQPPLNEQQQQRKMPMKPRVPSFQLSREQCVMALEKTRDGVGFLAQKQRHIPMTENRFTVVSGEEEERNLSADFSGSDADADQWADLEDDEKEVEESQEEEKERKDEFRVQSFKARVMLKPSKASGILTKVLAGSNQLFNINVSVRKCNIFGQTLQLVLRNGPKSIFPLLYSFELYGISKYPNPRLQIPSS